MKVRNIIVLLVTIFSLVLAGCGANTASTAASGSSGNNSGSASAGKEVTLKAVSAWVDKTDANDALKYLINEVNDKGKGQVQIKLLGGPEVVPTMQLINAVKNGTVDIAYLSASYTTSLVPEALAFKLIPVSAEQMRQNGLFDLFNKIYQQKANSVYLGWGNPNLHFCLYSNVPIKTLADFKGKPFRGTPAYQDLITALGAAPVTIDPGEVYTALDKNVVVGYGWQTTGIKDYGWDTKTKYIISPDFYQTDAIFLVNKDKWNSLSDTQKKILTDSAIDMEKNMEQHWGQIEKQYQQDLVKEGLQMDQLSPEDSKTFLKLSVDSVMNTVLKTCPEYGPQLQKLLTQK